MPDETYFARLVSLACHDLRTPLATVHGFARTLARVESGRYDPNLREANTLELAQAAAARLGEDRVRVTGSGAALETDVDTVERGLAALFQSALRHGGFDEVAVDVGGT